MISAPLVAKSAGVTATNTASDDDTVTVVTTGEGGTMSMSGTVCGDKAFLTGKTSWLLSNMCHHQVDMSLQW